MLILKIITTKNNYLHKILFATLLFIYSFGYADIRPTIFTTPKNISIILLKNIATDLVSVSMAFQDAGSKNDPENQAGLAFISARMLWRNSSDNLDRYQRDRKFKELGVIDGIKYNIEQDNITIKFKCPEENLPTVLNMVAGIITNHKLENEELNKLKNFDNTIRLETTPELEFANYVLDNKVFSGHPYGVAITGSSNSVQTLTLKDIKTNIKEHFAKNNLILSIVGNIEQNKISQYVDQAFVKLPETANLKTIPVATPKLDGSLQTIIKNSNQTGVAFALPAPNFNSPDFYPMIILNRILGAPFTGRLFSEIRDRQGLVYQIGSSLELRKLSSLLTGYFKCENKNLPITLELVKKEIIKLQTKGITEQELIDAKSGTIGEFALNFITTEQTSEYLLWHKLLGRTIQDLSSRNKKINDVTMEQVNKVAAKYLNTNELTIVLVGNQEN